MHVLFIFSDSCWFIYRFKIRNHGNRNLDTRNSRLDSCFHMCVRCGICMVMGSIGLVSTQWDLSIGNQTSGTSHQRLSQHVLHFPHRSILLDNALSHEVWSLLLLCRHGCHHDHLHLLFVSGDQRCSHWRDGKSLEATLVLEKLHSRWRSYWWTWWKLNQFGLSGIGSVIYVDQLWVVFTLILPR